MLLQSIWAREWGLPKTFRSGGLSRPHPATPSHSDWLSEDHQVYFLLDLVDELDLSAILIPAYAKDPRGEKGFDPRMMTLLLLYGYCVGVVTSRRIESACYEDLALRMLIQRDLELNYSNEDLSLPLVREEVNQTGDTRPQSLVLAAATDSGEAGVAPKVILEYVMHRMEGSGQESFPSRPAIAKHLAAWERAGMVEGVGVTASDVGYGGRPKMLYKVPRRERSKAGVTSVDWDDQNTWGEVF